MRANSSEIARQLGVSQRHARRLRAAGDARLQPVDGVWVAAWLRKFRAEQMQQQTGRILQVVESLATFIEREKPPWAQAARSELQRIEDAINKLRDLAPPLPE